MTDEPTVGDLARFLEANPGKHRIGGFVVEYVGTFDFSDRDESNPG